MHMYMYMYIRENLLELKIQQCKKRANITKTRTGEPIIANGACTGLERGLNGNGRPVERSVYGKFFLTRTVHVYKREKEREKEFKEK